MIRSKYLLSLLVIILLYTEAFRGSQLISNKMRGICSSLHTRHQPSLLQAKTNQNSVADVFDNSAVSLGAGVGGLMIILFNRLMATSQLPSESLGVVSDIQSRSDILAVMACSAVLLNVLSDQDFATRERDIYALVGYALKAPVVKPYADSDSDKIMSDKLIWLMNAIIATTPIKSVYIVDGKYNYQGAAGVLSSPPEKLPSTLLSRPNAVPPPILAKAILNNEEVYLPDLQILPGKIEFSYLPLNCQSVYILPLSTAQGGAVIMGTNQAKVLKFQDLNKLKMLAELFSTCVNEQVNN